LILNNPPIYPPVKYRIGFFGGSAISPKNCERENMPPRKRDELKENLRPDDISECYSDYADDMGQIARISQRIKTRFADFKKIGGNPKDIQMAYKLEHMDDPLAYLRGITKTAAILRIIPTETESDGQVSFLPAFDYPSPEADAKVAMSRVRADGYNAGKAGGVIENCPFQAGSEEFVIWRDNWEDGAADRAKMLQARKKENVEGAPTEKRGRGRPPGSKNKTNLAEAA
jgi:ribosome modulation factor